jgi:hypothetical protein
MVPFSFGELADLVCEGKNAFIKALRFMLDSTQLEKEEKPLFSHAAAAEAASLIEQKSS